VRGGSPFFYSANLHNWPNGSSIAPTTAIKNPSHASAGVQIIDLGKSLERDLHAFDLIHPQIPQIPAQLVDFLHKQLIFCTFDQKIS
jgi:hypothetical protein